MNSSRVQAMGGYRPGPADNTRAQRHAPFTLVSTQRNAVACHIVLRACARTDTAGNA